MTIKNTMKHSLTMGLTIGLLFCYAGLVLGSHEQTRALALVEHIVGCDEGFEETLFGD